MLWPTKTFTASRIVEAGFEFEYMVMALVRVLMAAVLYYTQKVHEGQQSRYKSKKRAHH